MIKAFIFRSVAAIDERMFAKKIEYSLDTRIHVIS